MWRSSASEPWEGTYTRACLAILTQRLLAPGAELLLDSHWSRVIEILGDSLPNGRYYFTALVRGGALPAGEFDLVLARPPLPESLTLGLITYTVGTSVSPGSGASVHATVTLTHAGSSVVEYPKACAVELVAYRSRERRDTAARSGAPDRRDSRSCVDGWQQRVLKPGQSIVLETAPLVRDILGSSLPDGTYYFAVVVHTRTRDVWLSAGSAELRR